MNKKFEDIIAEQGRLIYTNVGDSMFPVIRERDLLIIEAVKEPLKVGDVPLYKRDSGQYVLHRIVAIKKGKYSMKGDNRTFIEKGITDKHIIGVLTGIVRNGKTYPVETLTERDARIAKDVIYLTSCAVNEETPDKERVENMDLAEVFRLSQEHMLTEAVAFALEQVITLPLAFDQAKKKAIHNLTINESERMAIAQEFEKAKNWYLPPNGILLKELYPKSAMRQMTDEDLYLLILTHTYKQYFHGKAGLRSLLDVYVFLRAHPDLNRDYLDAELAKLEITAFEEKIRCLSQKVFTGSALDKYEQSDLNYYISSGNAGTYENQEYNKISDNLGGDDSKESKRRYLKSRFFISGKELEKNYPFFAKHKSLYPFLLIYRPIKGAITHPKGILTEYKKIQRFKKKEKP